MGCSLVGRRGEGRAAPAPRPVLRCLVGVEGWGMGPCGRRWQQQKKGKGGKEGV